MAIDHLIFDTTDANTIADSHSVGAFVRSDDGTLITHHSLTSGEHLDVYSALADGDGVALTSTLVSGKQALDVNIVEGINVEVDLSHLDDSVRLGDGTDYFTSTTIGSDIGLDVNIINNPFISNSSILSSVDTLAVAGTAEKVVATNLVDRDSLFIYNNDNRKMYIGGSGVDKDNGFPISPGSYIELRAGDAVDVYYDSELSGHEIRVLELA